MTGPATPPTAPLPTPPVGDPPSPSAPVPPTGGGDTPPVATDPPGTEATPPTPVDEWADFDAERAKQTILDQRRTEADLRARLTALGKSDSEESLAAELAAERKKVKDFERAQLSEAERVRADLEAAVRERDEARRDAAELTQRQAFDTAATAAGILPNALAAARVIAADVASSDESGTMIVDDTLFASLKADHGYLFTAGQARPPLVTFGAASSQGHGGTPTTLTPQQVAMAHRAGINPEDFANAAARIVR